MRVHLVKATFQLTTLKDIWSITKKAWSEGWVEQTRENFNTIFTHVMKIAQTHDMGKHNSSTFGTYVADRKEAISLWQFLKFLLDEKYITDVCEITQVSVFISTLATVLDGRLQTNPPEGKVLQLPKIPTTRVLSVESSKTDQGAHPDSGASILELTPKLSRGGNVPHPEDPQKPSPA